MFSVEEWHELERFKDLVLNTFDLISFILVTPELVRLVKPTVTPVLFLMMMLLFSGWSWMMIRFLDLAMTAIYLFVSILAFIAFDLLRDRLLPISRLLREYHGPDPVQWPTKHAFVLGAGLFFASRVYGVLLAAHEGFGWPK